MSVLFEKITSRVCKISINRPEKRNAINLDTLKLLIDSLAEFENDKQLHAAIINGVNGNFCSGYDLNEIINKESGAANVQNIEELLLPLASPLSTRKFTIAAIDGYATGFGLELALRCDFRVVDHNANLGFLNRRFGIPSLNGGTILLPKLLGHARAPEIIATGRCIKSPEALQIGLVSHSADIGCTLGKALNMARSLSKFEQSSLLNDLKNSKYQIYEMNKELFKRERDVGLKYLKNKDKFDVAQQFLFGNLCRHGNTDLGNSSKPESDVSL